jgi:hypothetical protein
MIKKIILKRATQAILNKSKLRKFVKRGGKIKQLPAQKSIPVFKHADPEKAQKSFKQTFGKLKEHETIRIADATELAAKELATTTANVKWQKQITKFVTRKRSTLAGRVKTWRQQNLASGQVNPAAFKTREASANYPLVKRSVKKAKIREYNKALTSADTKAKSVYQKTHLLFTGKSGADPLKHKLVETKFITTKKFRKGPMDDWSKSMMPGKQYSKMERGAYGQKRRMAEFANLPGNKTKQGEVMWNKFWKKEGPRQEKYIKGQRKMYKEFFKKKK